MAKRKSNGEGTFWFVKSEGRYRAQYYDGQGKRRTLSAKTQKTIEQKLRNALSKRDSQTLEAMPSLAGTVAEMLQGFLESKKGKVEFKTLERYSLDVHQYLIPEIGMLKLNNLTPELIENAYTKIQQQHGKNGLSGNSMAHINSTLRGALKRALRLKKIAINPLDHVDTPKRKQIQVVPLTESELQKVLNTCESQDLMWRLMWRIHLFMGFRQGEVLGLEWGDINFEAGSLYLHQQLQRQKDKGLVVKSMKADSKSRTVYLDEPTLELMRAWKRQQAQYRLELGSWGDRNFIFTNQVGKPMEPRRAAKKWAELLECSGISHIKLHGARHTFATVMLQKDVDTKVVTHYLGHSNTSTTQNIYQHVNVQILQETAVLIGQIAQ